MSGAVVTNAIVKRHDGIVGVISSGVPGEGSTFYVELPLSEDVSPDHQQDLSLPPDPKRSQGSRANISTMPKMELAELHLIRALVVDDSKLNRKMLINGVNEYFDNIIEVGDIVRSQYKSLIGK